MNFSSFPPEQEQSLLVHEQHMIDNLAKAKTAGIVACIALVVVIAGIVLAIPAKHDAAPSSAAPAESTAKAPAATAQPTPAQ